ncbi:CoA pyrophosphatase [Neolewinella lacunae]|uniref:CoA pyrophosphatase n=1 Tax=Neolewinella lacunae TaxID=1517758 RepID=A0A923PRU4_9BACT|nr:CoA pyrophosphatase [Neolewinella lacunae]MBC6996334.1 CoA pyrophosphatase [Neolewinella lacunae]MDN3636957.1 CoA pyrophosphatase [Neolewinella lacunae]
MDANAVNLLARLRRNLQAGTLPGFAAQQTMSPPFRGTYPTPPPGARLAAVLALFYPIQDQLHLLFIQRTSPANDRHAGQISFPGGSRDADDADAAANALRETEEEVGIPRTAIELLGPLTSLYVPVSNFLVEPFVGFLPSRPQLRPQPSEVARTLELPFTHFLDPSARVVAERRLSSGLTLPDTPHWAVGGEEIWGATSMMVAEIVALAQS